MKNLIHISALFIMLIGKQYLYAQSIVLKGKVFDKSHPEYGGLPGIILQIKDTDKGVITDVDGNYSLACNMNDVIQVSFVGFEIILWTVDREVKDFYMEEESPDLSYLSYLSTVETHSFSLYSTYAHRNKDFGIGFDYRYSFDNGHKGINSSNSDFIRHLSLKATYTQLNFSGEGLLYPQAVFTIPFRLKRYFRLSGGLGYYWHLDDFSKFRAGNLIYSSQFEFLRTRRLLRKGTLGFSLGYNGFVKYSRGNHFYLGISFYPSTAQLFF